MEFGKTKVLKRLSTSPWLKPFFRKDLNTNRHLFALINLARTCSLYLQFLFTSYSLQIYCLFGTTSDTVIPSTEHHVKLNHSQKHSFRDCQLHDHSLPPGSLELPLPTFSHVAMEETSPGCSNFRHCYASVKSLSSGQLLLGKKPTVDNDLSLVLFIFWTNRASHLSSTFSQTFRKKLHWRQ